MPSITAIVTHEELEALFDALSIWGKITSLRLDTQEISRTRGPAKTYPGATSRILVHHNIAGAHACTTHQIIDSQGAVLHWDASDLKVSDVTVAKSPFRPMVR